jgi:endonuclease/exonuclease/phosphatase family metal-dependent hydrolase
VRVRSFALVGLAFSLAACVGPARAERSELRVLTYNIHHGRGADGQIDLQRICEVILSTRPHLVALQEVDRRTGRSKQVDQAQVLGSLTGMEAHFGRAIDYDGGQYGEAVLLGLPGGAPRTYALPASPGHEERAALAVPVTLPSGEEVLFVGTHLDHTRDPADRLTQSVALTEAFSDQAAIILAGDLNAEVDSPPLERLLRVFSRAGGREPLPTYPSDDPVRSIDHVLFRLPGWSVKSIRVLDAPRASDHAPLLVVFERQLSSR